jgi:hypothetical protein
VITELQKAETLARWAHKSQKDLSNVEYVRHLERVVTRLDACGDHVMTVGWLHDIVEDTVVELQDLRDMGFSAETVEAVDAITHRPGEPLESYWTRVKANPTALVVKLHGDMPDNNDPHRHTSISPEASKRIKDKYARAILHLTAKEPTSPAGKRDAPKLTIPDVEYREINGGTWPTVRAVKLPDIDAMDDAIREHMYASSSVDE